jgi:plasmid stability protein
MGNMTVRNLPDIIHDQLREQAALHNRSVEAEVRSILIEAVRSAHAGGFGQRLHQRFKGAVGDELSVARDQSASDPDLFR